MPRKSRIDVPGALHHVIGRGINRQEIFSEKPMAGRQLLSKEAVSIAVKTIEQGASAHTFTEALEICYKGFGEIACTDAAKEGISAFLEKRRPEFKK